MEELTEVPLSNYEVLKVLNGKNEQNKCHEIFIHLKTINPSNKYPLEKLRELKNSKNLKADLTTLAILSNTEELKILDQNDIKIIKSSGL